MEDESEKKLLEKFGEQTEEQIKRAVSEFGGLLNREAAVRLLCRQNGIDTEKKIVLSEAHNTPLFFSFEAKIDRVFPTQVFQGGIGRLVRLQASDITGEATIVLWNKQADLTKTKLFAGCTAEFRGAFFRDGEIKLGRDGEISVLREPEYCPIQPGKEGICTIIKGEVREVYPDFSYNDRRTNEKKGATPFLLCQGEKCARVIVWGELDDENRPSPGEEIVLENASFKGEEIHANSYSRVVILKSMKKKEGTVENVSSDPKRVRFSIDGAWFELNVPEFLEISGIRNVPDGVMPDTIARIKSEELSGKKIEYHVKNGKIKNFKQIF